MNRSESSTKFRDILSLETETLTYIALLGSVTSSCLCFLSFTQGLGLTGFSSVTDRHFYEAYRAIFVDYQVVQ